MRDRSRSPAEVRETVGLSIRALSRLTRLTERTIVVYESGRHDGSGLSRGQIERLDLAYGHLRTLLEAFS